MSQRLRTSIIARRLNWLELRLEAYQLIDTVEGDPLYILVKETEAQIKILKWVLGL